MPPVESAVDDGIVESGPWTSLADGVTREEENRGMPRRVWLAAGLSASGKAVQCLVPKLVLLVYRLVSLVMPLSVAVIGGGITGATAVSVLVDQLPPSSTVTLFDQGRGLGGRTSHRRVRAADGVPISPEGDGTAAFRFDHGCQFFRADSAEFRDEVLPRWIREGWAAQWEGRFGSITEGGAGGGG